MSRGLGDVYKRQGLLNKSICFSGPRTVNVGSGLAASIVTTVCADIKTGTNSNDNKIINLFILNALYITHHILYSVPAKGIYFALFAG